MFFQSISWWFLLIFATIGCFTYGFGRISKGSRKELIIFVGGLLWFGSIGASFFLTGLWGGVILFLLFFIITPIITNIMEKFERKLFSTSFEFEEDLAKKLGISVKEMRENEEKFRGMNPEDVISNVLKESGIKKELDIDAPNDIFSKRR